MTIKLGDIVRDKITGFTGIACARTVWLHNCERFTVQPREVKDGKPHEAACFDSPNLEFVEKTDIEVILMDRPKETVELGDLVEDRLSGLTGVAAGWTQWINGCSRVFIQPKELVNGKPAELSTFDEKDLVVLEEANPKPKLARTGGPRMKVMR